MKGKPFTEEQIISILRGHGAGSSGAELARKHGFRRADFGSTEVHQLAHDIQNDYWVLRP